VETYPFTGLFATCFGVCLAIMDYVYVPYWHLMLALYQCRTGANIGIRLIYKFLRSSNTFVSQKFVLVESAASWHSHRYSDHVSPNNVVIRLM
jgi:hypothetical protein